jgi:dipeptidyl aminopeptidase/acylaminoacyl peptidase
MNNINQRIHRLSLAGSLLIFVSANFAFSQAQPRPPRKVIQPINLTYDVPLEGVTENAQEAYIQSIDGLYIPAVILKPKGKGPFPAIVSIHGSPGGRGMSELKSIAQNRGMASDRFLKEGYAVVSCDYRRSPVEGNNGPTDPSFAADVVAVIRFAKSIAEVDPTKVCIYSGSLGSESTVLALGEESVAAAVINSPAGYTYMHAARDNPDWKSGAILSAGQYDKSLAHSNLGKINTPTLFVVGTADKFLPNVKTTVSILKELGKDSSVDTYDGEKHGFYWGPNKQDGKYKPSSAFAQALDKAINYFDQRVK